MTRLTLLLAALLAAGPAHAQQERACSWQDVKIVEGQVAQTTEARLQRDWLDLKLGAGKLIALEACEQVVGLVWRGEGTIEVGDPGVERGHILHNLFDNLPGENDVEAFVLVGSDGAVAELLGSASPIEGKEADGVWGKAEVPFALRELAERRLSAFDPLKQSGRDAHPPGEVLWAPGPEQGGLFVDLQFIGMKRSRKSGAEVLSPWMAYTKSGTASLNPNPITWRRRPVGSARGLLVADLPTVATLAGQGNPFAEERPYRTWDLSKAELSVLVEPTFGLDKDLSKVDVATRLTLKSLEPQRELVLQLTEGRQRSLAPSWGEAKLMGVGLIEGEETKPLRFSRVGDRVFVHFDREIAPEESLTLRLRHKGALIEPAGMTAITPLYGSTWYPTTGGGDRHEFEVVVDAPRFWRIAATGEQIEESDDGKMRRVVNRTRRSVIAGHVYLVEADPTTHPPQQEGQPTIRVYRSPNSPAGSLKGVADDVWTWIARLEGLLGPYPFAEIDIVERGRNTVGLVTPGVLPVARLDAPPDTSMTSISGSDTLIRALARQWLDANMGANSDHDRWLIEGLTFWAEALALTAGDKQSRAVGLSGMHWKQWRDALQRVDDIDLTSPGNPASTSYGPTTADWPVGALWLGESSGWGRDNRMHRGPLVLQLLRMTLDDKKIKELLRYLTKTYSGQRLTTSSFIHQATRIGERDLRRFFYGWVYATPQQPVARVRWSSAQAEDGTWEVVLDGWLDDGRPEADALPIEAPFFLSMKVDGNPVGQRIFLTETEAPIRISGIPAEPRGIKILDTRAFPGKIEFKKKKK